MRANRRRNLATAKAKVARRFDISDPRAIGPLSSSHNCPRDRAEVNPDYAKIQGIRADGRIIDITAVDFNY